MNLFENWGDAKGALLEGLAPSKKKLVDTLLENTKSRMIAETAASDVTSQGSVSQFNRILLPMIRRVIPGTIATELVGVQPMHGPVDLVFSMRYTYGQDLLTGASLTDITHGNEIFAPGTSTSSKTKRFYTGGMTAGTDGVFFTADDVATGFAADTGLFESFGGRTAKLEVLKQTVTAGTRKLQAKMTLEAMQDLSSQHGLDLESELTRILSTTIVTEIDNEIITDLQVLAGTSESFDMNGTFTGTPHYVGDRHAVLGVLINKVANEIGRKIRRGNGNFVVVSPLVASVLQSASKSVFAPAVSGTFEGPNNTKMIGTLNGTIKVYSYIYFDQGTEPVIVGYKGGDGETDTGYFYCPYIPLESSGIVTDPVTFNKHVSLMTRYGKATFTNTSTSLGNSADYYGKVTVANLAFV
ncbi:hypothetical protein RsoM2USA_383 [Ralstonia phage RsoM2USA]|nr:hypothetical protein RsoM2USA_383 [Ralstonia phage RsoM2USA]